MPRRLGEMKALHSPSRVFTATDAATADFLIDRGNHALIEQFWHRENTVASTAQRLALPANAVLYRVKKMLKLKLLEVARLEKRRGRPIAHYRLAADEFYIPFAVTQFETKAAFVRAQLEPLFEQLVQLEGRTSAADQARGGWGVQMAMNEHGNLWSQARLRSQAFGAIAAEPKKSIRAWGTAVLTPTRAERIVAQLGALLLEIASIDDEGSTAAPYLFQLTMMAVDDA